MPESVRHSNKSYLPGQRQRAWATGWVILASVALYGYALGRADTALLEPGAVAMAFQIACWAIALILLARRHPLGQLRISDPGVLAMLWSAMYFIYPSVVWFQGGRIPDSVALTTESGVLLFWLHGLFMLGFVIGYLLLTRTLGRRAVKLDTTHLPSGKWMYLLWFLPFIWAILVRLMSGGGLLPEATYGEMWYGLHADIQRARAAGGLAYLWVQINSKIYFYPPLVQSIGGGLLLVHALQAKKGQLQALLLLLGGIAAILFFGSGGRSGMMIVLIAFAFADFLCGPLPWRYAVAAGLLGLVLMGFMGIFRTFINLGLQRGVQMTIETFSAGQTPGLLPEFTSMLGKEALAIRLFGDQGIQGPIYLVWSVLQLVPSQLLPYKFEWYATSDILAGEMLRDAAALGGGTAGAMIGDGYRLGGVWGVPVLAALLGAIFGLAQRWLHAGVRWGIQGPVLLKVALLAGLYGWTFNIIRADLSVLLYTLLYNVVIPWLVLSALLNRRTSVWVKPVPLLHTTMPAEASGPTTGSSK